MVTQTRADAVEERHRPPYADTGLISGPLEDNARLPRTPYAAPTGWGYSSPSAPNPLSAGARDRPAGGPSSLVQRETLTPHKEETAERQNQLPGPWE